MAHIDALIDRVSDSALRQALRGEVDTLLHKQSFGLHFQRHLPETIELPNYRVHRGCKVRIPSEGDQQLYRVERIKDGVATIASLTDPLQHWDLDVAEVVAVREFGEPLFAGLTSVGRVDNGGDKPYHVVINAENFHALETLLYTHEGKVDAIYIDPPYNNGKRTWKYNNNYVDAVDFDRHSKWLAMMQRRLALAARLLKQHSSVLIVTVDENEVNRLALVLEDTFKGRRIQMITTVINPKGASLGGDFARVEEYVFFVYIGAARVPPTIRDMLNDDAKLAKPKTPPVKWSSLIRGGAQGVRTDSFGAYYPVYIDSRTLTIHSFGDTLPWDRDKKDVPSPEGTIVVWPPTHTSGVEGRWGIGPDKARELYKLGALRLGKVDVGKNKYPMSYLSSGIVDKVVSGEIVILGTKPNGALIVRYANETLPTQPRTVWRSPGHNAGEYGTKIITALLPGRRFPFPKALYAVEDTLRFFIGDNREAIVLDFFGGSGTTTHAVARLNRQDRGRRQCILVTNNEVSAEEANALAKQGFRPGDADWENTGICNHITIPRVRAAFTGLTPDETPIEGDYTFTDTFPMSEGFDENVEFFELTYENPDLVSLGRQFEAIAPLLWLKAGAHGTRVDKVALPWSMPAGASYGILFDTDKWREFVDQVKARPDVGHVFIVTDSEATAQHIFTELPSSVGSTQLYGDYLRSFEINTRIQP